MAQGRSEPHKGPPGSRRWGDSEYLANLAEDETENANFRMKHPAAFAQLKRAYEDWDRQMLPIPPEVRRGAYGDYAFLSSTAGRRTVAPQGIAAASATAAR